MEIITDAPRRALIVTPHPDDCEGGCGGTLGKWVKEHGTEVVVVLCTNGDKGSGDREMTPARLAATREHEQLGASSVFGAKETVFLAHPDGGLEDSKLFRSQVVREIRRHRPDIVFGIDPYRSVSHTHRDHRMSGQVALDASYSYAWSHLYFPEQITEEGLQPHWVKEAYLWGTERPNVFVDIGNYLSVKADSLAMHASQMGTRTYKQRMQRVREGAARQGEAAGLPFAEAFHRIKFDLGTMDWRYLNS